MSLNGALQVGRSAIVASQAGMQVAGNNMANAATPGFHRRSVHLGPARDEMIAAGTFAGTGVTLQAIRREVDTALQARLRDALGQESRALIDQRFLTGLETLHNELTDNDLSSALSEFFNGFSELANNPEDHAARSLVVESGLSLVDRLGALGASYRQLREELDGSLSTAIDRANGLLDRIAELNGSIARAEQGLGDASSLRDQRDVLIDELAGLMEVTVIEQPGRGTVDILVDSAPVLLGDSVRGLEARFESVEGGVEASIRVAADGTRLQVDSGRIGGLLEQRRGTVEPAMDDLDTLARSLIHEVNRLHSQGQGRVGFESLTGTVPVDDTTVALNDPRSGLRFAVGNGSFFVHVTHQATGVRTTHQVTVDGNATSLDDLIGRINGSAGVPDVTAGAGVGNALTLDAAAGFRISFSDDTSGVLAALGVNTFFTGHSVATIGLNPAVEGDPNRLAAGAGHVPGSNDTALALAGLRDAPVADLGDQSLRDYWQRSVNDLAVATGAANQAAESATLVRESLAAQVQSVSGVSFDEESINLLTYQRQFQAAARFIAVIDETLQTLLSIA